MLLTNYAIRNAGQSRALGGNLDPTYNFNLSRMNTFYVGDNNVVNVTDKMSLPSSGYRPPYSLVLAPKAGGASAFYTARGTATSSASGVAGIFFEATVAGVGTATATLSLTASVTGSATGSGSATGTLSGAINAVGSSAGVGTGSATISATMGATGAAAGIASAVADLEAYAYATGTIYVNQSEATVQQIVDAVWNALAAGYNLTGTMGEAMNGAGSAGNPWITDLSGYNTPDTAGKILKDRLSKGQFIGLR